MYGLLFAILPLAAVTSATTAQPDPQVQETPVDFLREVQPILAKNCLPCHGHDKAESGVSFIDLAGASAESDSGERAVVPGNVDASEMIARITTQDESMRMPPENGPLSPEQIEVLSRWIAQGANWTKHWAFEPIQRIAPPQVASPRWNDNPIDAFLFRKLATSKLTPNRPADRATLIRRAYYDLIGLPPTAAQVKDFVDDPDPDAFSRVVEQLLDSPHYGEQWARHWLDLVRYAETNSYERDGAKPNAWKYRDYVIRSFNEDKPYDQFVREQLAGDELDQVTTETLTATGFYRLGIWDDEPVDAVQARFDGLDDILMTTSQVLLGLTVNCARCHDHKIDPIPQKDYYRLLAFFEDITPYATRTDQRTFNQIDVTSDAIKLQHAEYDKQKRSLQEKLRTLEQAGIVKMSASDQRATEGPKKERNKILQQKLRDHLDEQSWKDYLILKRQYSKLVQSARNLPARESVLGLASYRKIDKPTFVLFRGNPHSPGDEVKPQFPTLFDWPAPSLPVSTGNSRAAGRRRVLADWITHENNFLTARVMANRIWQFHFGRGIVQSSNNFGQLGTPPTHPELLDWLACQLIDHRWKLKPMHRLILSSRAYQMSSASNEMGVASDPDNRWFWRFNPRRLSAEEVRDSVLVANGSLNRELYGPSIYPKLSQEVLQGQSRPGSGWGKSTPKQRNRRSIYIHVKRSLLDPMLTAFDFPDPDSSCEARFTTVQPCQALTLLNSESIHEQAQRLADSIGAEGLNNETIVQKTVTALLARRATAQEVTQGDRLIQNLEVASQLSRKRAIQLYCLSVMNWNEFMFLD